MEHEAKAHWRPFQAITLRRREYRQDNGYGGKSELTASSHYGLDPLSANAINHLV